MLKVRFLDKYNQLIQERENIKNYYEYEDTIALKLLFLSLFNYKIVDEKEKADICIVGIQHTDNNLLRDDEINIFLSLENFSVGRDHYQHFNKFGRINPKIKMYYYNDIAHNNVNENIISVVYCRVNYFNKIYNDFDYIRKKTEFKNKKFCLFTSRNMLNNNKPILVQRLLSLGRVDTLDRYNHLIYTKTHMNSPELLDVFNQYKFVLSIENSKTDGYVTEKIFNVFCSGSIPIYDGAPNILDYINEDAFIQFDDNMIEKVKQLKDNEELYNEVINKKKTKDLDYSEIRQIIKNNINYE